MIKQNIAPFICPQRLRQLLMRMILVMCLNQSIVELYQTYKNSRTDLGWIDSVVDHTIDISKYKPLSGTGISNYQKN